MPLSHADRIRTLTRYALDFATFCREGLGYTDMLPEHEALCAFLQHEPSPSKLVLMPRYTFKSCIATVGYALWRLAREDSLRILIYSDAAARAEAFLTDIKNHVLAKSTRSTFRTTYGAWEVDPKLGVWNQTAIVIKPRRHAQAEPSVDTAGLETSRVGAHYGLILFDDLVTKENVTTKEQMDKVHACYQAARSLLKPGGEIVMTGTRWHFGDLYGRLLAEDEARAVRGEPRVFAVHVRDAEVAPDGRPYPFAPIGLTQAFLDGQRADQGTYLYSCLYRLNPIDDATAAFKAKDFRFYDPATRAAQAWLDTIYITCCVDPAISQATDADETAITVVGTDPERHLYLLDAVAGHLLPDAILDTVFALWERWHFTVLGIETVAFQKMLAQELDRRRWQQRRERAYQPFRIEEFAGISQRSKASRILGLQPYHENGRLHLPGERLETLEGVYRQLALQLLQFPHSAKDDLIDSLAYHPFLSRAGVAAQPAQPIPFGSAAWFERRQRAAAVHVMARQPRWQRRPLPPLVFS